MHGIEPDPYERILERLEMRRGQEHLAALKDLEQALTRPDALSEGERIWGEVAPKIIRKIIRMNAAIRVVQNRLDKLFQECAQGHSRVDERQIVDLGACVACTVLTGYSLKQIGHNQPTLAFRFYELYLGARLEFIARCSGFLVR
jgi:hypothetical protein